MVLRQNVLKQIEQFISTEYLSIANVCFFMQSIRILLEIDDSKSKYKITSHYCNWMLHKELDRSSSPLIIKEITRAFNCFTSERDLTEKVTNALSVQKLVQELKEILWVNVENKILVSKMDFESYWLNFITILLNQIVYRPLKLNNKNILLDNRKFSVYGIQLINKNEAVWIEILSTELNMKDTKMMIKVVLFRRQNNQ